MGRSTGGGNPYDKRRVYERIHVSAGLELLLDSVGRTRTWPFLRVAPRQYSFGLGSVSLPDGSVDREETTFLDARPLSVVETRLQNLPEKLVEVFFPASLSTPDETVESWISTAATLSPSVPPCSLFQRAV